MMVKTHTEPGGKEVNEDFVLARRHPSGGDRYVCVLADGQGGRSNGALAARTACEIVWARAMEHPFDSLLRHSSFSTLMYAADNAVCRTEGYTTLVALALDETSVVGASSGDSKVFFARKSNGSGELEIVEWTARQQKNPPVGSGEAMFTPFSCAEVDEGRILMLSDGVWKYCGFEAIRAAFELASFADAASVLKAATLKRSGSSLPDDFSVIAIEGA
jgi:serine/threonine protein phosphatase PrpC